MDFIYNALQNEKNLLIGYSNDLEQRSRYILERINYHSHAFAVDHRGDIELHEFDFFKENVIDRMISSFNTVTHLQNLGASSTLIGFLDSLKSFTYNFNNVNDLKTQLNQFLNQHIGSLQSTSEKASVTIAVKIGIATVDYWTNANSDKWKNLYGELGFVIDEGQTASLNIPISRLSLFSQTSNKDNYVEMDNLAHTFKKTKRNYFVSQNVKDVMWADIAGGVIGGVTWGIRLGLASGGSGALAGFFVGGLLQGANASAQLYIGKKVQSMFGW